MSDNYSFDYCNNCKNKIICRENQWCITMDRNGKVCDNYKNELDEIFEESKIFKFNDCDTVYIPKGYTLQQAIDWYTSEYDEVDYEDLREVDYIDGFWDCDVPKEKQFEIMKENPSNYDMWNLSKDKKIQEGTIEYRFGDLFIYKTFKTAKEENDKEEADIFVICSTEF